MCVFWPKKGPFYAIFGYPEIPVFGPPFMPTARILSLFKCTDFGSFLVTLNITWYHIQYTRFHGTHILGHSLYTHIHTSPDAPCILHNTYIAFLIPLLAITSRVRSVDSYNNMIYDHIRRTIIPPYWVILLILVIYAYAHPHPTLLVYYIPRI